MRLECSGKVMKFLLVIINIIFLLLGIGMMIPGILVRLNADFITDNIKPVLDKLSFGNLNLWSAVTSLSIAIIILGVFIIVVSGLGLFGALCQNRTYLILYGVLVLTLFVIKLAIIIVFAIFRNKVETEIRSQMKTQLETYYEYDDLTSSAVSSGFNILFIQGKCCGIDAVISESNTGFSKTPWQTRGQTDKIPKACCGAPNEITTYKSFSKPSCTVSLTEGEFYSKGCYDSMRDLLVKYSTMFIGVGAAILVLEVVAFVGAFMMFRQLRSDQMV